MLKKLFNDDHTFSIFIKKHFYKTYYHSSTWLLKVLYKKQSNALASMFSFGSGTVQERRWYLIQRMDKLNHPLRDWMREQEASMYLYNDLIKKSSTLLPSRWHTHNQSIFRKYWECRNRNVKKAI